MTTRPNKDPAAMTAGEVNRELKKLDAELSANGRKFIDAGHGDETYEFILSALATDPLSRETQKIPARRRALLNEVERECGPGMREFPKYWRRNNHDVWRAPMRAVVHWAWSLR